MAPTEEGVARGEGAMSPRQLWDEMTAFAEAYMAYQSLGANPVEDTDTDKHRLARIEEYDKMLAIADRVSMELKVP
jgi:hypothetical protein